MSFGAPAARPFRPVVTMDSRVLGTVGLRELMKPGTIVDDVMSAPLFAAPDGDVLDLVEPLTTGRHHAAIVVDAAKRVVGVVTQTDLISALAKSPLLAD